MSLCIRPLLPLLKFATAALLLASFLIAQPKARVVLVSVDGLDYRYLRDRDKLGLKIPNLRRLLREGEWASGVVGEVPTITWPAHTTLLTGVPPSVHGIQANQRWDYSLIKCPTLWDALRRNGLTSAAITWPVTVNAPVTWNLPEYFEKRQGGAMDLAAIRKHATPGLLDEISAAYPSFAQQWMDDRTRTLAAVFLIERKHPDFLAVHLVDLDAEEHDTEPFSPASNAMLEYTDELIGRILAAVPATAIFALVSDHGFAAVDKTVYPAAGTATGGLVLAHTATEAAELAKLAQDPANGIGRRVSSQEWKRFMPGTEKPAAVYEPAERYLFSPKALDGRYGKPHEAGVHGLWPGRPEYRSVFLLRGPGIQPGQTGEISMLEIAPRLNEILIGKRVPPGAIGRDK
ncbi:MAG: ectonucleotide pyrophosphatase/phosphodiesterase [Bryobacteraceae bacterium]